MISKHSHCYERAYRDLFSFYVAEDKGAYRRDIYRWLDRLPETCTIFTDYFPDRMVFYDQYLFMFETDYEDFIIELFSELPASTTFFKVSKKLFTYIHIPKQYARTNDLRKASNRLPIPLLILDLLDNGIIEDKVHALAEYFKKLFTYIHIPKRYARNTDFHKASKMLYLPLLTLNLLDRGIIKDKEYTIV